MPERIVQLPAIKETTEDFEAAERRIKELFKREIYFPLLRELAEPKRTLKNSGDNEALLEALRSGRVTFSQGTFSGKFSSSISGDLRALGATFDRKSGTYKIRQAALPLDVRNAIAASSVRFQEKIDKIDRLLAQKLPEEIADLLKVSDLFDRTLWKTDRSFLASVRGITVAPQLTPERRKRIADEWQNNMRLWIKEFSEKEIVRLRAEVQKTIFTGNRYGSLVDSIQASYGVTAKKAKFLARQETSLLMTKFKESRYTDSGVTEYRWGTVAGSKNHPVRPSHKRLEGKIFRWDNPPITTEAGEPARRNNPGQDYNCRCFAKPIVRFRKDDKELKG